MRSDEQSLTRMMAARIKPITGAPKDYDPLLDLVGDARFVLLGEASHGTHDFYQQRALITRRLIREKGFSVVAVEGDWPDAYQVNKFVRGCESANCPKEALSTFERFPRWMWRNKDVVEFASWLREYNARLPRDHRVGFYGLDLYSLYRSLEVVIRFLDGVDPAAAKRARARFACFEEVHRDPQAYAYAAHLGLRPSCERQMIAMLIEIQHKTAEFLRRSAIPADELFNVEQNARVARNAEQYYRTLFQGRVASWNLRDEHMAQTLEALSKHTESQIGEPPKVVVWAHNSHLGDARATELGECGELNLGQLVRQRYGKAAVLVGFTTHHGSVIASSEWEGLPERKNVRPALSSSFEALMHRLECPRFIMKIRDDPDLRKALSEPRLERAIGVVYLPESERQSHYFHARLGEQFDALVHLDETRAIEPLDPMPTAEQLARTTARSA